VRKLITVEDRVMGRTAGYTLSGYTRNYKIIRELYIPLITEICSSVENRLETTH
jgi:hypothetical protein